MDNHYLKQESIDMTEENIRRVAALFPNCVTEAKDENGRLKHVVNFEMLKQMLSPDVVDGAEHYEFTWVGKKAAIVEANKPIRKTLRPCPEESKNWDTTENLYIEGDNLKVLKLLQENYLGKVKMIYIDPPYNTKNDFIFRDNFTRSQEEENAQMGMYDDDENRLFKNTDANGRFHSDWCSMIYSRLMLARNLLVDDGIIFISIDDNEVGNLRKICDEVFGERNFVNQFCWINNLKGRQISKHGAATTYEYILCWAKCIEAISGFSTDGEWLKMMMPTAYRSKNYNVLRDSIGEYVIKNELYNTNSAFNEETHPTLVFQVFYNPITGDVKVGSLTEVPLDGYVAIMPHKNSDGIHKYHAWRWSASKILNEKFNLHFINCGETFKIYTKIREHRKMTIKNLITDISTGELSGLLNGRMFDFVKPVHLLTLLQKCVDDENGVILDFFSGSATTAHAVMQLNAEDGGHRRFIMVQLPEKCDEKSEAFKAGYKNICEIGKERIRRAGEKIVAELKAKQAKERSVLTAEHTERLTPTQKETEELNASVCSVSAEGGFSDFSGKNTSSHDLPDIGFRVLKVADSNMKDVYYAAGDYTQDLLSQMESNIKEDRTDLDLLFGCLLDWGLPLSCPYTSEKIEGCTVHTYNDGDLIACFDANIPESVIKVLAKRKPIRAVFRDSSFASSPEKINVFEIFKLYAPDTSVKVI